MFAGSYLVLTNINLQHRTGVLSQTFKLVKRGFLQSVPNSQQLMIHIITFSDL